MFGSLVIPLFVYVCPSVFSSGLFYFAVGGSSLFRGGLCCVASVCISLCRHVFLSFGS